MAATKYLLWHTNCHSLFSNYEMDIALFRVYKQGDKTIVSEMKNEVTLFQIYYL